MAAEPGSIKLLSVADARVRMLARIAPLETEIAFLDEADGRVLAEDVLAERDQPPFAASAMDGWAVRSADTPGTLRIIGESAAGHGYDSEVGGGEAVRIFTGAAAPAGCDAVVIQENAEREGETVRVPAAAPGTHLRPAGGDFRAGERLLSAGTRLDPWRLSLAAAAGRAQLSLRVRPRVAVIATGEEIIEPPAAPGPWQIYDSGTRALAAMIRKCGGEPLLTRPVRDDLQATIDALAGARADLVVTLGGASVGDHDLVRAAGQALGLKLEVASIAVRPGKPTFFGVLADGRPMLGLPGNPASAFVCAELFLKPILAAFQGAEPGPRTILARAGEPLATNGPREHWMRAQLLFDDGAVRARPWRDQDSSLVSVFAAADALLRRPACAPATAEGELVEVLPLARA